MLRTILLFLVLVATLVTWAIPVQAKGHPTPKHHRVINSGFVYLTRGLLPGHRYRIVVQSTGRTHFAGMGFENYTWIYKRHAGESTKPLTFSGNTPKSFLLAPPVSAKLVSWIVALSLSDSNFRPLRVSFKDLGTHR